MLGSSNNWNIIKFSHKAESSEDIDKINQVILNEISENMAELVQTCNYGTISTTVTTTVGYYVTKFWS